MSAAMTPAQKMGRLANGNESDQGSVVHAVPEWTMHYGHTVAACGTRPGRRSGGWHVENMANREITCPRCLRRVQS